MIGDENDYMARGIQGICSVLLAFFAMGGAYMLFHNTFLMWKFGGGAVFLGSVRLCYRCARYAITGRGNINRDDF